MQVVTIAHFKPLFYATNFLLPVPLSKTTILLASSLAPKTAFVQQKNSVKYATQNKLFVIIAMT